MSYDPTNTHQGCTEKIQAEINVLSGKSQTAGSLTIVGDHEELLRRFCHYRDALDYCLATLKHHHMTKGGISTLVAKTEKIKNRANENSERP